MTNNNPNIIDITQISEVSNANKLNITGISNFTQITNINNIPNNNNLSQNQNQSGVNINQLDINKNYSECESTLEFFIISLSRNLKINPNQAVALLSNNRKYLLRLFYKGIQNDFSLVLNWLKDINKNLQFLQSLMINSTEQKNVSMTFSTLSVGLYSTNIDCVRITNTILSKLAIEIGTDWDWFYSEGYLCYIFSLEKNGMIKNKLLNGFSLHIKEHEDDIIKLFKEKYLNEEDDTGYKDIGNFIFNLLPILGDNLEDKDKKFQNGIINLIVELIENNNGKIKDIPFLITMATQAWVYYPDYFSKNKNIKNSVLNLMKENIRTLGSINNKYENLNINVASSISNLFFLLNNLGKIKNEDGPLIYKTLVFLFIEEYDDEFKREFMLDNFSNFFLLNLKFPIDIFISPYFKQIKRVKNISMSDFNFIAVIIGHPRFNSEHALDLLDFILDISVSNLIFSKSANMLLNLIFSMKLLIKNKSVFEQAQTIFKDYIIQMLTLYITNLKSNVIDNTILEVPYDILLEGFGNVNQEIESTLINTIDQYRSIKGKNSKPLLGLLWFYKSHDDVLLRLEEKYTVKPKKIQTNKNNNGTKNEKTVLKPINKNKFNNINKKNEDDDINNVLKKSIDLALKKMKGEKEEKMKIKKEKLKQLEQKRLKELKLKKNLEKELAKKNEAFNTKKQRADTFIDEANFSQMNLIQEEGSVISQINNTFIRRPLSKTKLNTLMNYNNNNKYTFIVNINEEESREEKGIEALNIKYKSKIKNLVRILTDDSGNITKASILRYFRNKKINNSDLTLDELSLCVRQTFSANINLFDENQFKKLLVTISYLVMSKRRNNYSLYEAYYNFLKIIIDDLDVNINWKYKKYINILKFLKNNLDVKTGEIDVLLPPGFKIVQKTEIIQKSKIPKPMLKNFTESYVICISLVNEFLSNILNSEGVLEKYLKVKKLYDIEIELSMVHPWTESVMIAYSLLPKNLEKFGIEAADALENGLKKYDWGTGETKMGNYEKEKLKKEHNNKLIEQKKEDIRKKRGKEIKSKVEQYKKEKEEKERIKKELEEKKKEEEQKAFHDMLKERKKINKKKKEEINKFKAKKEEEKKEKIIEQQNKEKEEEKIHKEEQTKFLIQQNKKMKEQFKQMKQQKDDYIKKKQESLPENQKIPKNKINYFKEEKNYIDFDRNLISKIQTLMNSTNNISNYIKIYDLHLKLIFEIYHKVGQNKITSINRNIDDSLYINEYKEFLTNFGLLNILITKDQMNFIYNRLTRKTDIKENNNEKNSDEQKQYLTFNDFRMSLLLLTIMTHLNNKDMKITEDDYNNILTVEKIEELFEYLGLKIPYIRKDLEALINSRRGMSAKDFFVWQQTQKKEYYDKFKGIQRKENNRKNSLIPHSREKKERPKSSVKLSIKKNEKTKNSVNDNIKLKRVGSKDCIDEYNNINRKKIYKTDKNDINSLLIQNKENNSMKKNKILVKKNSFKINSNTINKNGSPNKKKEKIVDNSDKKININTTKKNIEKNKKKEEIKNKNQDIKNNKKPEINIKKLKKPNNKDKPENKIEEKNIVKENLNIAKNEIENNEIKSNENSNIKTKDTNLVEDIPKNIENNTENKSDIINKDDKNNIKDNKIMDNSDVSIVYDSSIKKDNENNDSNKKENQSKGYNMKIKTADGKEEDWNIQE